MIFVGIGIIYYFISSLLLLYWFESRRLFPLDNFEIVMMFIPFVRIIYIIYKEWL